MTTGSIRVLEVAGRGLERGRIHGETHRNAIRAYAEERVSLACSGLWSKHPLDRDTVLDIADRCLPAHADYSADLVAEMEGIAEATGLSLAEVIIVGGFTDIVDTIHAEAGRSTVAEDDCTTVLVPSELSADNGAVFAQTWDMHDSATEHVILLDVRPDDGPRSLVFTTNGCVGQIGMNEHGICVGINNLPGADGMIGVTWPLVVRKALMQTTLDDALACITEAPLAGARNYVLLDAAGAGYNIEAFSTRTVVTPLGDAALAHTNHCLHPETEAVSQPKPSELQESSEARLEVARATLADGPVTIDDVKALMAHPVVCYRGHDPFHVETCGATIMSPASGDFWACWGLPSERPYEHFSLAPAPA